MVLTHRKCETIKPGMKPIEVADEDGLYLRVTPRGKKSWLVTFVHDGRRVRQGIGSFPDTSLLAARQMRDNMREAARTGGNLAVVKEGKLADSFEAVYALWAEVKKTEFAPKYFYLVRRRMERYVLPEIGKKAVSAITPQEMLRMIQAVEKTGAVETARRIKDHCARVFDYAKFEGMIHDNPCDGINVRLQKRRRSKPLNFLMPSEMADFFSTLRRTPLHPQTAISLEIVIRTFVRTAVLRDARWPEIDGDLWRVPAARMKVQRDFLVPLPPQVVRLFAKLREVAQDDEMWIPARGTSQRPRGDEVCKLSENTMLYALYRMGYKDRSTVHGFRSTASTFLNETGDFSEDAIERQLAHDEDDKVRAAYNHAQLIKERWAIMHRWNKWLDQQDATGSLLG